MWSYHTKKTEGLSSGVSVQSKQQVLNFFPICFSHWCLSVMLCLAPSLSRVCGVFCHSLKSTPFFLPVCVCVFGVCIFVALMTPQLCVHVRLCNRYLGLVHPTYLCQLRLLKPSQLEVHTRDNTHAYRTH